MKPELQPIGEDLARPFISEYCERWGLPYDPDEALEYGQAVLWVGAFYENALRAVVGLLVADEIPDFLFVYGFYGDGSIHQMRPIRALIEFVERMPYGEKAGYIVCSNDKMLHAVEKFGWDVTMLREVNSGVESVKVQKVQNG